MAALMEAAGWMREAAACACVEGGGGRRQTVECVEVRRGGGGAAAVLRRQRAHLHARRAVQWGQGTDADDNGYKGSYDCSLAVRRHDGLKRASWALNRPLWRLGGTLEKGEVAGGSGWQQKAKQNVVLRSQRTSTAAAPYSAPCSAHFSRLLMLDRRALPS